MTSPQKVHELEEALATRKADVQRRMAALLANATNKLGGRAKLFEQLKLFGVPYSYSQLAAIESGRSANISGHLLVGLMYTFPVSEDEACPTGNEAIALEVTEIAEELGFNILELGEKYPPPANVRYFLDDGWRQI